MSILSIRLTDGLNESLNQEARVSRQPKSLIARIALERLAWPNGNARGSWRR